MSYCKEEGKDKVIFLTKEDYEKPSTASLEEEEEEPGLILDNGDINWSCPCLGGMATGPCGVEFREAFSCFHYSEEEIKGADCYDQFKKMQDCMSQYPDLYDSEKDDEKSPFDEEDTETTKQISESNDVTSDTTNTEKTVAS